MTLALAAMAPRRAPLVLATALMSLMLLLGSVRAVATEGAAGGAQERLSSTLREALDAHAKLFGGVNGGGDGGGGGGGGARALLQLRERRGGGSVLRSGLPTEMVLPQGLSELLESSVMPEAVVRAAVAYGDDPLNGAVRDSSDLRSGPLINLDDESWADVDLHQASLDASILSLVGNSLQLATGPLAIVQKSLSTLEKSIKIPLEDWSRFSKRYKFLLNSFDFGQTLYKDFNSKVESFSLPGDVAEYIMMYNKLTQALDTDKLVAELEGNKAQLENAARMIEALGASQQ